MDKEENLDLLDLEDTNEVDALPEATPFSHPRPKKPWLLMGLGLAIIVLATWIIVARIGGNSSSDVSVDLNVPGEQVENGQQPDADLNVPAKPAEIAPQQQDATQPQPVVVSNEQPKTEPVVVAQQTVSDNGSPVRVVADRKDVTFNPDKPVTQKPVAKAPAKKTVTTQKTVTKATNGNIYVQFGSYGTREAAQNAERKMRSSHASLFSGKQFVILAANVKGQTKYRLRVAFNNAGEADGFCKNAKSDGLDCYVTK